MLHKEVRIRLADTDLISTVREDRDAQQQRYKSDEERTIIRKLALEDVWRRKRKKLNQRKTS